MTVKAWPFEFVEFHSRRWCGVSWVRPGDGMYDEVESIAATFAAVTGKEIDIIAGSVMPSGAIGSRERIGMRVMP